MKKCLFNILFDNILFQKRIEMTPEEITQFQNTIKETILPLAQNMTGTQIQDIVKNVPQIDDKFKSMLLEQILIMKNK